MLRYKSYLKKDDKVRVTSGKDKGKIGKVVKVNNKKKKLLIENINMIKKHMKPNAQTGQGGIVETEGQVDWSNVMLICNKCLTPGRIKAQILEDGKKVRVCRKCNEIIDA